MNQNMETMKKELRNNIQLLIDNDRLEDAMNLIEQYINIDSNDIEIYSMKAVVYIKQGNLDEAEIVLKEGLIIGSRNFDLNYNLGYLYEQKQNFNEAIRFYNKAQNYCNNIKLKKEIDTIINSIIENNNLNNDTINKIEILKSDIKKVLFVQSIPDIRTNKIAQVLSDKNIKVDIMYFAMHPNDVYKGFKLPYEKIYRIEDINQTINVINKSDYDIIFSCNEPDYLTALLSSANKPLVHDCHDMMSLRGNITNEGITVEYLANTTSNGNIYITNSVWRIAQQKFNIGNKPVMILDNYILRNQLPESFLPKLSSLDGEIHCVYEGGLTNIEGHHRNIQDIFMKLIENNIHVHYYVPFENEYYREFGNKSKYLHYEGTKEPNKLIEDMTKYDIGLTVLNVTQINKTFLDTTFPNKAWEYLAAGLPILFSDLYSFRHFLNIYKVGEIIDLKGSIVRQVERVKEMKIPSNFLVENKLCMDDFFDDLYKFLSNVKKRKNLSFNQVIDITNKNF